jgi:dTDP-glucose 4,6-dehydratase
LDELEREYRGRTCFVTGADGFIGSHMVEQLVAWGADVRAFVRATSSGELRNIGHLRGRIRVHRGNLTDKTSIDAAVRELAGGSGTIVFHLGAQAHVGESWERPFDTVASNILGTLNLLQSLVDCGVKIFKFDMAGTSEEYGNVHPEMRDMYRFAPDGSLILNENSPINPKSIYATSKIAADFLTMNFVDAYGLPGVTTRMFNNYGPRQNPRYVTGTIITQALSREKIEIGYTQAKRDFCFVTDGVHGHLSVALYGNPGEVYVYGHGHNISIEKWMHLILDVGLKEGYWGEREVVAVPARFRPGTSDVEELRAEFDKLHAISRWHPRVSWEEGIARTIRWYAENRAEWIGRVDWADGPASR